MNMQRCFLRAAPGILLAVLPPSILAQLAVNVSLSKAKYLAGEPVFLDLTVTNRGTDPIQLEAANPLTICSGYRFELQGATVRDATTCTDGFAGSCLSGFVVLAPGKSVKDRVLLNARYDLRQPSQYQLRVSYTAKYAPVDKPLPPAALMPHQEFDRRLEFVLVPSAIEQLKPEFSAYLHELDSANGRKRQEAAEVIAYLAPVFMEPAILRMLHTPGMQSSGVEGLRNLGTPSAHRALAEFVGDSPPIDAPGTYQNALRYLGEIGNSSDVPVLLGAAHANAPDSYSRKLAIEAAARAGGAAAIPALETELRSPSRETRLDAVGALPMTGSRTAVPVLIQLLRSPNGRISSFAEHGLEALTHLRGAKMDGIKPPPPEAYSKWSRWWMTDGQTENIFKPSQCGEIKSIP